MVRIWAKSNSTTLEEHTNDLLSTWQALKILIKDKLNELLQEDFENLQLLLELSIKKHDIGKFLPAFQKRVGNTDYLYEVENLHLKAPHSLVSVLFKLNEEKNLNPKLKAILNSVVAYHHYRDYFDELLTSSTSPVHQVAKELQEDAEWREKILNLLMEEIGEKPLLAEEEIQYLLNGGTLDQIAPPPYKNKFFLHRELLSLEKTIEKLWLFTAGLLQRVDHFASFIEEEKENIPIEEKPPSADRIWKTIRSEIEQKGGKLWQADLIEEKQLKDRNVVLIAPTGSGKTEFALLWGAGEKIFYTLPLRSAVNQIFDRFEGIYGKEKVGLLHSDADLYLMERVENREEEDVNLSNAIRTYETSRHLSYPAIVSTGDQFFPYALKPPLYERIYVATTLSRLVIDEIQAYDPKAIAIVVKFVEEITNLGGKSLIITATLPEFAKNKFEELGFEIVNLYEGFEEFFKNFVKHKYTFQKVEVQTSLGENEGLLESIISEAQKGKRVLVVVNTVRDAEELYEALFRKKEKTKPRTLFDIPSIKNSFKLFKIHSEMTLSERKNIEELLKQEFSNPKPLEEKEGKILVATQVVEASLDLDADVLFTFLAPLDALVQRMGRVARRYSFKVEDWKGRNIKVINKSTKETFDSLDFPEENEPNVYVLIKVNKDGKLLTDKIYPKELIELTLLLLGEEYLKSELRKTDKVSEKINEFIKNIPYIGEPFKAVPLSEYEKQKLLTELFKKLEELESSAYLSRFYKTISILQGGYFSNNRREAQMIFREIYSIWTINEENYEEVKRKIFDFIQKNEGLQKGLYTLFKEQIISKYFVPKNIHKIKEFISPKNELIRKLLTEKEFENLSKLWKNRLRRWLGNVYIIGDTIVEEENIL